MAIYTLTPSHTTVLQEWYETRGLSLRPDVVLQVWAWQRHLLLCSLLSVHLLWPSGICPCIHAHTKSNPFNFYWARMHTFHTVHIPDTVFISLLCIPLHVQPSPLLQDYVQRLSSGSKTSGFVKARSLCHSIAGNSVPILTITSPVKSQTKSRAKRAVVMTARVHPGETNGSWMMKGFLDFITGQSPDAKVW